MVDWASQLLIKHDIIGNNYLNLPPLLANAMSTLKEIESAVSQLSANELTAFRDWFAVFDAAAWDRQIEADVAAGKLDELAQQALQHLREGRCTDL